MKKQIINNGLSNRDKDIFFLMSEFGGKTFLEVLERTFWHDKKVPLQQAKDRIGKIKKKYNIVRYVNTGLMKPRSAIAFSDFGKRWIKDETNFDIGSLFISPVTAWHNIYEQITYYWLKKAGRDVSRTIVKNWSIEHKHTPDLLYFYNEDKSKPIYVEIELNKKITSRYVSIIEKMGIDKVHAVLYVFESEKKMIQIGRLLPIYEKLYFIHIDELIKNISTTGKIGFMTQQAYLEKYHNSKD